MNSLELSGYPFQCNPKDEFNKLSKVKLRKKQQNKTLFL